MEEPGTGAGWCISREARGGSGPNISAPGPKAPEACQRVECVLCVLLTLYVFVGLTGDPGLTRAGARFSTLFSHRFFEGFFFIFTSFLDHFLKVFSYFFHLFFETFFGVEFLNMFLMFLILSFSANPRRHAFYCSPLVYKRFRHFRKSTFLHEHKA